MTLQRQADQHDEETMKVHTNEDNKTGTNDEQESNMEENDTTPFWPTVQALNARVKKLVRAYHRMLKRIERQLLQEEEAEKLRQFRLERSLMKPGHGVPHERIRHMKCVPMWSKKEKADFAKLFFNIGAPPEDTEQASCWLLVRRRAGLTRKTPEAVLLQSGDEEGHTLNCLGVPSNELANRFSPQELEDARMTLVSARKFKERRKVISAIRSLLLPKLDEPSFISAVAQCLSEARHDLQPWWNTELDIALARGVAKTCMSSRKKAHTEPDCVVPQSLDEVSEDQRLSVMPKERPLITRLWYMVDLASSSAPLDQEHGSARSTRSGARAVTVTVKQKNSGAQLERLTRKLLKELKNMKKSAEFGACEYNVDKWLAITDNESEEKEKTVSNSFDVVEENNKKNNSPDFEHDAMKAAIFSSPESKTVSNHSSSRSARGEDRPRAPDGTFIMPLRLGVLTIESLGVVDPYREGFHSERAIYPIGFRSRRHFTSMVDVDRQCDYICEIVDSGENRPLFRVTCEDLPEYVFEETSASGCWCRILKVIRERTPEDRRRSHVSVSGPEYFGFVNPLVLEMIQELPNADHCERYKRRVFLPPGTIKKQRVSGGYSVSNDRNSPEVLSESKDSAFPVS
eukprot:jgi/Galph1/5032/GphlegSOOS_G57.1